MDLVLAFPQAGIPEAFRHASNPAYAGTTIAASAEQCRTRLSCVPTYSCLVYLSLNRI